MKLNEVVKHSSYRSKKRVGRVLDQEKVRLQEADIKDKKPDQGWQ